MSKRQKKKAPIVEGEPDVEIITKVEYIYEDTRATTRVELEYHGLKTENNDLKVSYETLSAEKNQLQSNVVELEAQRATIEEREKQDHVQVASFEGQIASLTSSLKDASE